MRSFIVGTAGHIDHGKTSLVRALTGVDTDRLAEEKRRGITIELGFAHLDLGRDDATAPDLAYIEENFSEEPRAAYLRSVIAARQGDPEGARDALQQTVAALAPMSAEAFVDNPALQLIQGLAYYGLKQYEAAAPPLRSYIAKEPQDLGARKALGDTLLRLGAARAKLLSELTPGVLTPLQQTDCLLQRRTPGAAWHHASSSSASLCSSATTGT